MTLPNAHHEISVANLYPDAMQIIYQYDLSHREGFDRILPVMREAYGFSRIRGRRAARAKVHVELLDAEIEVEVARHRRDSPLRFTARLNPLRSLHEMASDVKGERALNCASNWLHADHIENDNRWVWEHAHEMIVAVEDTLATIADNVASEIGGVSLFDSIVVGGIEVAFDIGASDPEAMARRLGRVIQKTFRASRESTYRSSAVGYRSFDGDIQMIEGYRREGERYKVYPKTNRRLRVECGLSAEAIHAMGLRRNLAAHDGFPAFFEAVAENILPHISEILAPAQNAPANALGPLALLIEVARRVRNPLVASDVISTLVRRGHVSRNIGTRGLGARLCDVGILERSDRNLYSIAPRYQHALQVLGEIDEGWMDFIPGREIVR